MAPDGDSAPVVLVVSAAHLPHTLLFQIRFENPQHHRRTSHLRQHKRTDAPLEDTETFVSGDVSESRPLSSDPSFCHRTIDRHRRVGNWKTTRPALHDATGTLLAPWLRLGTLFTHETECPTGRISDAPLRASVAAIAAITAKSSSAARARTCPQSATSTSPCPSRWRQARVDSGQRSLIPHTHPQIRPHQRAPMPRHSQWVG